MWRFPEIGVPPVHHPFLMSCSIRNHPFGGAPMYGNPHVGWKIPNVRKKSLTARTFHWTFSGQAVKETKTDTTSYTKGVTGRPRISPQLGTSLPQNCCPWGCWIVGDKSGRISLFSGGLLVRGWHQWSWQAEMRERRGSTRSRVLWRHGTSKRWTDSLDFRQVAISSSQLRSFGHGEGEVSESCPVGDHQMRPGS